MSQKLFKFLISELDLIRIRCKKCSKVAEIPADKLSGHFDFSARTCCSFCGSPISPGSGLKDPFVHLAQAIATFKTSVEDVEVEFMLPDSD